MMGLQLDAWPDHCNNEWTVEIRVKSRSRKTSGLGQNGQCVVNLLGNDRFWLISWHHDPDSVTVFVAPASHQMRISVWIGVIHTKKRCVNIRG